jgi:acyl-phosphate glycerol 3-phosphate acyltransferase
MAGSTIGFLGHRFDTMTILCVLLFIGAMGKSAQLGLHTWLPDAMEGPTPVSALIHAATMVTAGVFMVCRLSPMFQTSPTALGFVTFIGAATCFFAATVGTCQWDIKRVIAYSTCSQLGYMFFAAGVGAYGAAMFHLFTHAFFKALLFLGAGSVIHAMHHEQDMRYYGALRKQIPLTFWAMMAGTLAITGVGIVDVFGFAGFYSKDSILEAAYASGSEIGNFAFWCGIIAVVGHVFSVFVGFKGGKGVATAAGMVIGLAPLAFPVVLGVWVVIVWLTGYVSLGSIVAAVSFPPVDWLLHPARRSLVTIVFDVALALFIIWKHRQNIQRLLAGTENRFGRRGTPKNAAPTA